MLLPAPVIHSCSWTVMSNRQSWPLVGFVAIATDIHDRNYACKRREEEEEKEGAVRMIIYMSFL